MNTQQQRCCAFRRRRYQLEDYLRLTLLLLRILLVLGAILNLLLRS